MLNEEQGRIKQYDLVLSHLQKNKRGLSQAQSIRLYGAYRLSAIIHRIRKNGYEVETSFKTSRNRYGYPVSYAVYTLK